MSKLEQAKLWVKDKYPETVFGSDSQMLIKYLEDQGTPVQNKKLPELEPKKLIATSEKWDGEKECPSCKAQMVKFNLCSACDKSKEIDPKTGESWSSVWICPQSSGLDSHINLDHKRLQTYRDYFIIYSKQLSEKWGEDVIAASRKPAVCNQKPVLDIN